MSRLNVAPTKSNQLDMKRDLAMATEEDLRAIFAYLQSIPAISNEVPEAIDPPSL